MGCRATLAPVSPALRVRALVALAAAAAVAAVVGITVWQTRGEHTSIPGAVVAPRAGYPPLSLELGLRTDGQARALARAQQLYNKGKVAPAASIFARYHSLEAQLGSAFAAWKRTGLAPVRTLAAAHPEDAAAQLHLGWADYWAGRNADAVAAWQQAAKLAPDSPYGVDAQDALHPTEPTGLPPIVTPLELPPALATLPAAEQLARLRSATRTGGEVAELRYGLALWNVRMPVSAEQALAAAAQAAPHDPVARVAAAVGRFSKENPTPAFGALGPLTAVFPHSPVVELHLGLLLLWTGEQKKAKTQLRAAVSDGPRTIYAKNAKLILDAFAGNGTK